MQENKNIELKNAIEKIISDENLTVFTDDYLTGDSVKVFSELERLSLINFSVKETQSGDDYYIQADYYNRDIAKAIILDYDFTDRFDTIEEMIEVIKDTEQEINKLNQMTSNFGLIESSNMIIEDETKNNGKHDALTIEIYWSENSEGYMYNIYNCEPSEVDDTDCIDGGLCTSNIINALGMAYSQAIDYLKK